MYAADTSLRDPSRPGFSAFLPSSSHGPLRPQNSSLQNPDSYRPKRVSSKETETMKASTSSHRLDKEQRLSAVLQRCPSGPGASSDFASTQHTSSIPVSQSQPTFIPSSPAARFLSAFCSPPTLPAPPPDAEGQVIAGYTLGSVIGFGGFSTIRRAYSASGGIVAVKIVRRLDIAKQPNAALTRKRLDHETAVWSALSHEHILPLFSAVHTSYADYFFTLHCPAGSLFDILKREGCPALPHDDVGMMFRQVVRGLRYMHEVAGYVHRDMKLENVLVDEMGVCRIGDFGMSRKIGEIDEEDEDDGEQVEHERLSASNGTGVHRTASLVLPASRRLAMLSVPRHNGVRHRNSTSSPHPARKVFQPGSLPYAAPELLSPHASHISPYPSQDVWALGVMLYALLTGRLPFCDPYEPRLQMKICNGVYEIPAGIGKGAERVLKGCLERIVEDRWSIAMVDEMAWGVGWGTEGDDVDQDEAEIEEAALLQSSKTSRSCSRSRSYPPSEVFDPDSPTVEEFARPHQEAASRRSNSRLKRSLSRAPVLADKSCSSKGMSRSISRHSRAPSPSLSGLNVSTLSNGTLSGSSSCYSPSCESALLVSPTPSLERGRRPKKITTFYQSRSPSPGVVPTTPVDNAARFPATMGTLAGVAGDTRPETLASPHTMNHEFRAVQPPQFIPVPETGVLEGPMIEWDAPSLRGDFPKRDGSMHGRRYMPLLESQRERRVRHRDDLSVSWKTDADDDTAVIKPALKRREGSQPGRGRRTESTPPASAFAALPPWSNLENRGRTPLMPVVTPVAADDRRSSWDTFYTPVATPVPVPSEDAASRMTTRSKSVGHARYKQDLYALPHAVEPITR
ncbi:hypothetical protein AX17_005203 [Amanita inopinata Kibby_2008]|nr:hypothetical protein AX17_005203 [Amanita inopinata Kibby_2008]